jgi:hypothetical protein
MEQEAITVSAAGDDDAQLKATKDERVKVLTDLLELITGSYHGGTAEAAQICSTHNDLCNALLDSTEEAEKRVALLTKQLEKASEFLKNTQRRFDSGTITQADVLRAKSLCLDIKIKLLRERNRKRPRTPNPTGKSIDRRTS